VHLYIAGLGDHTIAQNLGKFLSTATGERFCAWSSIFVAYSMSDPRLSLFGSGSEFSGHFGFDPDLDQVHINF
jgi:hypothetical protein